MGGNYNQSYNAMAKYNELQDRYADLDAQLANDIAEYKRTAQNVTGEKGIKEAQRIGSELAQKTAGQAVTQAQTAARQSGMSKAASAMLGSQQSANQYAQNLGQTTQQAYGANQDKLGAVQQQSALTQEQISNIDKRAEGRMKEAEYYAGRGDKDRDFYTDLAGKTAKTAGQVASSIAAGSDERLKHIFGECDSAKIIDLLKKINAIDFKYTDEAQNKYEHEFNIDNDEHIGVTAQDLEKNPLTQSTVEEVNGDKIVNTAELTMVNTATLSSLAKEIAELKDMVWKMQYKHDDDLINATQITNGE